MTQRIASLDLIRGFALFGVLAVNAPYFAAPAASVINPGIGSLAVHHGTLWAWAVPYVAFEYKSIALFSMLFGASLWLVGGDGTDPQRNRMLRRRLGWLAIFGLLHGLLFWFGDILLAYAIAGAIAMRARAWSASRLMVVGLFLFAASLLLLIGIAWFVMRMSPAELAAFARQSWTPSEAELARTIAGYRAGAASVFALNLSAWVEGQLQTILLLTPRTVALMMIGLALLKSGYLSGENRSTTYIRWSLVGAAALAALSVNGWDIARQGFPVVRTQAVGTVVTATLAPLVSMGYAALLILLLRHGVLVRVTRAIAAVGRMAFTNYVSQSVLLGFIFFGGRGLGLYGAISRPGLAAIVAAIYGVQLCWSMLWLRRFSHGPLEMIWRKLSRPRARSIVAGPAATPGPGGTAPAIESRGLTKCYGDRTAVDRIHLHVPEGAIYAFLGPNGAGKTTTIRMLLGLIRPTSGEVRVFGRDAVAHRRDASRQIGALLDARATYDALTGRENLDVTRRLLGLRASAVDAVLELVGLQQAGGRRVGQYSLGMRQRLGLARALLGEPRLIILDEPMNGLDPEGMADMRATIRRLPDATGATILLSSHLLDEVEQVATHIGLMRGGALVAQGPLADLLAGRQAELIVRTDADARAYDVLQSAGISSRRGAEGLLVEVAAPDSAATAIARILVGAGLGLRELASRPTDLESLYMAWTRPETKICSAR